MLISSTNNSTYRTPYILQWKPQVATDSQMQSELAFPNIAEARIRETTVNVGCRLLLMLNPALPAYDNESTV